MSDVYPGRGLIDPVCLSHGLPWSANPPHWAGKCMVCCLCFKVLNSLDEMNPLGEGRFEDVCLECAAGEREVAERLR